MGSTLFVDDDNRVLGHPGGLRPAAKAVNILTFTMSGSVQTGTLPTGGSTSRGVSVYRLVGIGQPVLYAIDASGASASYGDNTKMIFVPASTIEYFRADPADTTIYIVQGGSAGTVQISLMT